MLGLVSIKIKKKVLYRALSGCKINCHFHLEKCFLKILIKVHLLHHLIKKHHEEPVPSCDVLSIDLDFASLARGFALLRMPRMPELRGKQFPDFVPTDIDTDTIPFKDKIREKQRQKLLDQKRKERTEDEGRRKFIKNKAWSKQKAKKERKKKMNAKRKKDEVKCGALCSSSSLEPRHSVCEHSKVATVGLGCVDATLPHSFWGLWC